jgi:hypothetical protein
MHGTPTAKGMATPNFPSMNKSLPFAILTLGLLSMQCGLKASPIIANFVGDGGGTSFVNLSFAWMTVGVIGVVVGGFAIFWRRLL